MALLLWDASALAKRYGAEVGSDVVDALFTSPAVSGMACTALGYAETFSTLLRKRNAGRITAVALRGAKSLLRREVVEGDRFTLMEVDGLTIMAGLDLMEHYNINASDAAVLVSFLEYSQERARLAGDLCLLIAADRRLLRAAAAEGLAALNPEEVRVEDIAALLQAP